MTRRLGVVVLLVSGFGGEPLAACDPVWLPSVRLRGTATVVVRFGTDTVADLARPTFAPERAAAFEAYRDLRRRPAYGLQASVVAIDARSRWRPTPGTAGIEPRWVDRDSRWPQDRANLMSAVDYLQFVQALPTQTEIERHPREVGRRVDRWAAGHRALAKKEPARSILANLRRQLSPE